MEITLLNPVDSHVHLRGAFVDGTATIAQARSNALLQSVGPLQSPYAKIVVMPNIPNHVKNAQEVQAYWEIIRTFMPMNELRTDPFMTISLKPDTTAETVRACEHLIGAVKYYPGGVTTGSGHATGDIDPNDSQMRELFNTMADMGIALSLHPETTETRDEHGRITKGYVGDAEREFQTIAEKIAINHPNLKIIIEHISTADMAELVGSSIYPNIYGTVTPQHLFYTAHDKEGGHKYLTHVHCKSTMKTPDDLEAIQRLVFSAHPNVFFGSDSAPHPQDEKECAHCSSGVFSSPIALQALATWFMDERTHRWWESGGNPTVTMADAEERLKRFVSTNGLAVYPKQEGYDKYVTLESRGFVIPKTYGTSIPGLNIVPMPITGHIEKLAGIETKDGKRGPDRLPWSIKSITTNTVRGVERTIDIAPLGQIFSN